MFLYFASLILMIPPFPFLIKIIIVYIHYASITIMSISSLISATLLLMIYTKQLRSKLLILAAAALLVYGLIGIVPPIMLAVQVILPIIPWDIYALVVGNYLNMNFVGFVFVMNIPIFIVFGASIYFLGRKYDSFGLRLVGKYIVEGAILTILALGLMLIGFMIKDVGDCLLESIGKNV
mgnify:CR=1 FL=1